MSGAMNARYDTNEVLITYRLFLMVRIVSLDKPWLITHSYCYPTLVQNKQPI